MKSIFSFPNPVNDIASRIVAGGVLLIAVVAIAAQQPWLSAILAYGFLARVATGPTLSPLGQLATRVIAPRVAAGPRLVAGPPKRFAQAIGAVLTVSATVLYFGFGLTLGAYVLLGVLVVASGLESLLGLCLGCQIFSLLMRAGIIPAEVCEACANIHSPAARAQRAGG